MITVPPNTITGKPHTPRTNTSSPSTPPDYPHTLIPNAVEQIARRSSIPHDELVQHEKGSVSKKQRRVSEFDWQMLRRASELNGATDVALTFTDYIDVRNRSARRYEQLTSATIHFVEEVERVSGVPVSLLGTRFDVRSVIDRRRW